MESNQLTAQITMQLRNRLLAQLPESYTPESRLIITAVTGQTIACTYMTYVRLYSAALSLPSSSRANLCVG